MAARATSARSKCATRRGLRRARSPERSRGSWCLRIIISTSTPKSSGAPRTSMTRPMGGRVGVGQRVISTSTTRPSRSSGLSGFGASGCLVAEDAMRRWRFRAAREVGASGGMRMGWVMRSSKGTTVCQPGATLPRRRVVKRADDGGVAALEDARRCGPGGGRRLWAARARRAPGRPAWRR